MQATESTPALTAAQRLYLDVHGYVVIENVLDEDEIAQLTETTKRALYRRSPVIIRLRVRHFSVSIIYRILLLAITIIARIHALWP